jgi:hypothetical protein
VCVCLGLCVCVCVCLGLCLCVLGFGCGCLYMSEYIPPGELTLDGHTLASCHVHTNIPLNTHAQYIDPFYVVG